MGAVAEWGVFGFSASAQGDAVPLLIDCAIRGLDLDSASDPEGAVQAVLVLCDGDAGLMVRFYRVSLFFPDPWPKQRHHKRRLVQAPFVEKLHRVLEPGGHFHAATDWDHYAHQICVVMEADDGFTSRSGSGEFYPGPVERTLTKFEKRGLRRGHEVRDLLYERI